MTNELAGLTAEEQAVWNESQRRSTLPIASYLRESLATTLRSLSEARTRLAEADKRIMKYENDEASVCPEDVGFVELIGVLRKKLEQAKETLQLEREAHRWIPLPLELDTTKPPFDGNPVLILTNHTWCNRVHRCIWTDAIHGEGIYGWAVEDCKFGPYPLRGYVGVTHWQPLPSPPMETK